MSQTYIAFGAASPTTALLAKTATGTGVKTLLQVATPSTAEVKVIEWGISFDGFAAAQPVQVELVEADVAATGGTSFTPVKYGNPNGPVSLCVGGTGATGFGFSAEGTVGATRILDPQLIAPTNQYKCQFPLGREPMVGVSKFLRVRVNAPVTVNCYVYIVWEE